MPANDLKKEFRDAFMTVIATHDTAIRNALKSILTTSVPPDVKILLFETQSDWSKIPIVVSSMDNESPDETYYEEPFSGFLVSDGDGDELIPDGRIDQDHYEDNGIDTYDLTHDLLAEWISSIWGELGGRQFSIPAYIGGHDRDAFIDLRTETKCSSADIWPE